ncbi:MAG TPA: DinB family protein [Pseudonocardia sp.]|jgi:hypothetical protein|uniref:DinB family protein n=1 Tax=Pseudonocardia sp. TaxID=60912 RepID=UPI002C6CC922|nr:DinB family protein [Pseudonocardia sp.]HTF48682.1 DinB family protein [Pseudonocardia sp.]
MDRHAVHEEMERAQKSFHAMLDTASNTELRRRSSGTRWNNKQLLFHMLLGYLLIRTLRPLMLMFGRLPEWVNSSFAWLLNAAAPPFHVINYAGAWLAGSVLSRRQLKWLFDRTAVALHRQLDAETESSLGRGMRFPTRWDPFFRHVMTVADIYHYATEHYDFHRQQLTLLGRPGRP